MGKERHPSWTLSSIYLNLMINFSGINHDEVMPVMTSDEDLWFTILQAATLLSDKQKYRKHYARLKLGKWQ